jgi:hypothetical protein
MKTNDQRRNDHKPSQSITMSSTTHPHSCIVCLALPTTLHAEQIMRVMEVDKEIGDRVIKTFSIDNDATNKLIV